jgi:hypothetical protein
MKMKTASFFLFLVMTPLSIFAIEPSKNCEITVKYFYKVGVDETKVYHIISSSEKDCLKKANLYKQNTSPQKIKKKEEKSI